MPGQPHRYVQLGLLCLLAVSTAQVGWWLLDQWQHSARVRSTIAQGLERERQSAERLLELGETVDGVLALHPGLRLDDDGQPEIDKETLEGLAAERFHRLNRYAWEGGFFLVVLVVGMGVLARALRREARLRRRQHNFLAAVGHELKSPLGSSRAAAETLQLRDPPAAQREILVRRVIASLRRLESMVDNLLDSARIEEGGLRLVATRVRLASTLAATLDAFHDRADAEGVDLQLDLPDELEALADPVVVRTIARNILDNAFDAVREQPDCRVSIVAVTDEHFVHLTVRDNGRGFPPQESERLFERFYRPGDEMRRGGRGAGLGLHIVRALTDASGGRVEAHSKGPGSGATFRISLPLPDVAS